MLYCDDVDLLKWEPNLLKEAAFASQLLLSGTGDLAGTAFSIGSGSFTDTNISAGQVIVLSGLVAGCYPIVSVDGDTELTLSVLYDGLEPASGPAVASPVATANGLGFAIRTFWAQRKLVSDLLSFASGVGPEAGGPDVAVVTNVESLRRPCTLGTLQLIYSALAAASAEPANLSKRAEMYETLYRREIQRARVQVDLDGDGRADVVRLLRVIDLKRR